METSQHPAEKDADCISVGVGRRRFSGTQIILDHFHNPPTEAQAHSVLACCLAIANRVWVYRATEARAGEFAREAFLHGWAKTPTVPLALIGKADLDEFAGFVRTFWACDPGRWVLADAGCPERSVLDVARWQYVSGKCAKWMRSMGERFGFAAISYDDSIVECTTTVAVAEVTRSIDGISGIGNITDFERNE